MRRLSLLGLAVLCAAGLSACTDNSVEDRAKAQARKVQESFGEVQAAALAQNASEEDIRLAQATLTTLKEYQGEVNGKLDSVTVNAIQAFQRTAGLKDDGIITAQTREKLAAAAK